MPSFTITGNFIDAGIRRGTDLVSRQFNRVEKSIRESSAVTFQHVRALKLLEQAGRDVNEITPRFFNRAAGGGYGKAGTPGTYFGVPGLTAGETARRGRFSPLNFLPQGVQDFLRPNFRFQGSGDAKQYIGQLQNARKVMDDLTESQGRYTRKAADVNKENRRQGVSFGNLVRVDD